MVTGYPDRYPPNEPYVVSFWGLSPARGRGNRRRAICSFLEEALPGPYQMTYYVNSTGHGVSRAILLYNGGDLRPWFAIKCDGHTQSVLLLRQTANARVCPLTGWQFEELVSTGPIGSQFRAEPSIGCTFGKCSQTDMFND